MSASVAASAAKSPRNKKTKAMEKKSKNTAKPVAHPPWKDIIKEAITISPGDARSGVSRSTVKRYAEKKYKIEMTPANIANLNRAITHGAESGMFVLPKGPSGKIKLAMKSRNSSAKENAKPVSPKAKLAPKPAAKPKAAPKPSVNKAAPAKSVKKPAAATTAKARATAAKVPISKSRKAPASMKRPARKLVKNNTAKKVGAAKVASRRVKKNTVKSRKPASKKAVA